MTANMHDDVLCLCRLYSASNLISLACADHRALKHENCIFMMDEKIGTGIGLRTALLLARSNRALARSRIHAKTEV